MTSPPLSLFRKTLLRAGSLVLATLPAAAQAKVPGVTKPVPNRTWDVEVVMQTRAGLNGCAVADFDLPARNKEIAVTAGDRNLYLVYQNGPKSFPWHARSVGQAGGEMVGCRFADVDPTREGIELIAYGMLQGSKDGDGPGALYLLSRFEGELQFEEIFHGEKCLTGVAVGDFDTQKPGPELLVTGRSRKVHMISLEEDLWIPKPLMELDSMPASVADFSRNALVGCEDGSLLQLTGASGTWKALYLEQHGAAQLGVSSFEGAILSAREDGSVQWLSPTGKAQTIYEAKGELTTSAMGQIDFDTSSMEVVVAGNRPELVVLYGNLRFRTWEVQVVHRDDAGFNHVTIGEVYGRNRGPEVVATSRSGKLYVAGLTR